LPPPPPLLATLSLELDRICALSFGPADAGTTAKARAVTTIASASVILLNMFVLPPRHLFRWFFSARYYNYKGETKFRITRSDEIVRGGVFF
jgi:hypothetical protein